MRRLVVSNRAFLWRVEHRHQDNGGRTLCTEVLRIFAEGNKSALLRLVFPEQDGWQVGYPRAGVVWSTDGPASYNLNRPAVVAAIIAYAVPAIWDPEASRSLTVDDAIPMLGAANAPTGTPTDPLSTQTPAAR